MYGAEFVSNSNGELASYYSTGGGGGGGGISGGNNGVSVNGANIRLGHPAAGSGASDFTADRFQYVAGFKYIIGGTSTNNGFCYDGATGIVTLGAAVSHGSAILELISTTKGLLPPRHTTVQKNAVVTPRSGLFLYDVTINRLCFYDGAAWQELAIAGGAGLTGANNGVSASGANVQLGHAAIGSGASDFTANRFMFLSTYTLTIGGSALNNQFQIDGQNGVVTINLSTGDSIGFGTGSTAILSVNSPNIGVTPTNFKGLSLINNVAATAILNQASPNVMWEGNGWKTSGAGSQVVRYMADVLPGTGTVNPTSTWRLRYSVNGGVYRDSLTVDQDGNLFTFGSHKVGIDESTATQVVSSIVAFDASVANISICIVPKGTGSIIAQVPNGAVSGGNARGAYAVDLQMSRAAANQVASTNYSTLLGGQNNINTGYAAVICGGISNSVSGAQASVVGGSYNLAAANFSQASGYYSHAYIYGQWAKSSGIFTQQGDSQGSILNARRADATMTTAKNTILYTDGAAGLMIPTGSNRSWSIMVNWTGSVVSIAGSATGIAVGDNVSGWDYISLKRTGAVSSIPESPTSIIKGIPIMKTSIMNYSIGGSGELVLTFTGPVFAGGGTLTMRISATLYLTENAY